MPSSAYCSESCIKFRHASLKIHINLHYSSFDPLYGSFYFQLVFTFKRILRKGIKTHLYNAFRIRVKASIMHLYDALWITQRHQELRIFTMLYRWRMFPFTLTRSPLRSSLLVKCHPNALFFSKQRYSIDLVFQLLEFSIHKPTSSPLELFTMHTILPPIQYEKWFYQRRSITSFNHQLSQG